MHAAPRHRIASQQPLRAASALTFDGNPAHYLTHVLRLRAGDRIALFTREDGEWLATIQSVQKRSVTVRVEEQRRAPQRMIDCWGCFAPIKGGRLETIIEKGTELGAALLQPVITQRSIVDKVNPERAESVAREAAEQCERIDWPEIAVPKKLANVLGDWPADRVLIYGDETGEGVPITDLFDPEWNARSALRREPRSEGVSEAKGGETPPSRALARTQKFAILTGPEGGFTPDELAMLRRCRFARAVSVGPRILRADTAFITLLALTMAVWGDWHLAPRMQGAPA